MSRPGLRINQSADRTLLSTASATLGRLFVHFWGGVRHRFLRPFFSGLLNFFCCFLNSLFLVSAHGACFMSTTAACRSGFAYFSATCAGFRPSTASCSMSSRYDSTCTDQAGHPKTRQDLLHIFFHNCLLWQKFMKPVIGISDQKQINDRYYISRSYKNCQSVLIVFT